MKKDITLFFILVVKSLCMAGNVYIDDGASHAFSDNTYEIDAIYIDYNIANIIGTHVDLIDGGLIGRLHTYHNAAATVNGGSVHTFIEAHDSSIVSMVDGSVGDFHLFDNSAATIIGGLIEGYLWIHEQGNVIMTGGAIAGQLSSSNFAAVTIAGGTVGGRIQASQNGIIYLNGTDFEVGGIGLVNGDRLSSFGTFVENGDTDYYTGIIKGTLADGSVLDNEFRIYQETTADIIIIPEPCTLSLLAIGAFLAGSKRIP